MDILHQFWRKAEQKQPAQQITRLQGNFTPFDNKNLGLWMKQDDNFSFRKHFEYYMIDSRQLGITLKDLLLEEFKHKRFKLLEDESNLVLTSAKFRFTFM
jgi:hypothetical protein